MSTEHKEHSIDQTHLTGNRIKQNTDACRCKQLIPLKEAF